MRAGNTEIAARKPTASPRISNGGDILPDRTSPDKMMKPIQMKQMAKMPFAKDHHMVKTVPPDRADQSLHVCVLPWRARRDRSVSNAQSPNTPNEAVPVGTISVANKVSRWVLPTEHGSSRRACWRIKSP